MSNPLLTPVADIMREVREIKKNRPVRELVSLLLNLGVSEALVVDEEDRPVGVVTKTDVLRHSIQYISHKTKTDVYRKDEEGKTVPVMPRKAEVLEVHKIMSPKIFSLKREDTILNAMDFMQREGFHRMFVQGDSEDDIVGVVGVMDITKYLVDRARKGE